MKKEMVVLSLIFIILLLGSMISAIEVSTINGRENITECRYYYWFDNSHNECGYKEFCGTFFYSGLQLFLTREACEEDLSGSKNKTGLENITSTQWPKGNESECLEGCTCMGRVVICRSGTEEETEDEDSEKITIITENKTKVNTALELKKETEDNKTKLKVNLSNGRKAEIKIMPEIASQRAIERLGELNFTVQLKEVGKGEEIRLAYELEGEKDGKILGLFKIRTKIKMQIDAENGEVISIKKPWWAFLVFGLYEKEPLVGGCAGVYYEYWDECCENWAQENNIVKAACIGNWTVENNECKWVCQIG